MSYRQIEALFPNLRDADYAITSPDSIEYNCVAWAAGDTEAWWWPDALDLGYWPPGAPRSETLDAFIGAFETLGYALCDIPDFEDGFEKIVVYVDSGGKPTHVTRQTASGRWTSKLGKLEDIEHDFEDISGALYGTIAVIMKRTKQL